METPYDKRYCDISPSARYGDCIIIKDLRIYHQVQTVETAYDEMCCDTSPSATCGDCI